MTGGRPSVVAFGDDAVLVTLGNEVDPGLGQATRALSAALGDARDRGLPIDAPVIGYAAIRVPFDPAAVSSADVMEAVAAVIDPGIADTPERKRRARVVEVPTRYGGADGEDLEAVAAATGLSPERVIDMHATTEYEVYFLGFAPGFAYLGVLPEALAVPRRASPRARVPAGSVAIAERQTAIYPVETPGGWHLIGRTDTRLWDPHRDPPALLAAGDRVRFVPVR
ncbi:MAG TPA: 5-oxoprolinase subunit PxpB [Candidatus Limnocylindrales bacterium]